MKTTRKSEPKIEDPGWPADKVERRATSSLVPYARNARTHSETQVAQIAASIKEWGWTNPILVDEQGGIIAGHGRVLAAQLIGIDTIPVMVARGWTDAQKRAYILADNKLALNAGWDENLLKVELADLKTADFALHLIGFDADELGSLLAEPPRGGLTSDDDTPELEPDPITKPGEVWILGGHRLMCGDALSNDAVQQLLQGKKAAMVTTDPDDVRGSKTPRRPPASANKFDVPQKNDDGLPDIVPILDAWSTGWVFIWTRWTLIDKWIGHAKPLGFPTNMVIWSKGGAGTGDRKKSFSTDYEVGLVFNRGAQLVGKRIGSVWKFGKDQGGEFRHPRQKPVALVMEAIEKTTLAGVTILDIYGGSGATVIACEKIGRYARVMEADPRYVDVIVRRWQDFTGKPATLESDGRSFEVISSERGKAKTHAPEIA